MTAVSHVFTRPRAAARLGISEDLLAEVTIDLGPEAGVLWVHDSTEEGCYGFTLFGLESVQEIVNDKPILAFIKERMDATIPSSRKRRPALCCPRAASWTAATSC